MDAQSLNEDVLLRILQFCDVSTVLNFGQASRRFHDLAFSKSTWKALVENLQARRFIDRVWERDLSSLSLDDLVKLVKRVALGPESWHPSSGTGPTILLEFAIDAKIQLGPGILYWENRPKLIPGGKYVLFLNWGMLQCWDIRSQQCIWTYDRPYTVIEFGYDVGDMQDEARIVICSRDYADGPDGRKNFIEVLSLDFQTGTSRSIFLTRTTDTNFDNPFDFAAVSGDYAAVSLINHPYVVLIKLSTQDCRFWSIHDTQIDSGDRWIPSSYRFDVGIISIPPCLIVGYPCNDDPSTVVVTVWSLASLFDASFMPTSSGAYKLDEAPALATDTFKPSHSSVWPKLDAFKDPFSDSYIVWLHSGSGVLFAVKYRLSQVGSEITLHRIFSKTPTDENSESQWAESISFSGHLHVIMNRNSHILSTGTSGDTKNDMDAGVVDAPGQGDYLDVSAYSGALTYSTHKVIVVRYYK